MEGENVLSRFCGSASIHLGSLIWHSGVESPRATALPKGGTIPPEPPVNRRIAATLLSLLLAGYASGSAMARSGPAPVESEEELAADLSRLLNPAPTILAPILQRAAATRDRRFVAPLIELTRFHPQVDLDGTLLTITGSHPGNRWN